jgi:DNA-binding response OmpR family regulator
MVRIDSSIMSRTSAVPQTGAFHTPPHTIVVVEDEVLIRMPLAEYLRDCGYRVFEAADVAEAKAVLNADTPIDLMFTDVNMPGEEDGFVLARWVRRHRPDTKILVTSGAATAAGRAGDMRVDGPLLVKPYQYEIVLKRIEGLLGEAKEIGSGSGA